jgi:hypothetical protein
MIIGYTDHNGDHQVAVAEKARDLPAMLDDLIEQKRNDDTVISCWAGYEDGGRIVKIATT